MRFRLTLTRSGSGNFLTTPRKGLDVGRSERVVWLGQPCGRRDVTIFLSAIRTTKNSKAEQCFHPKRRGRTSRPAVRADIEISRVYRRQADPFTGENEAPAV